MPPLKGQLLTPRPLLRAWGERRTLKPANPATATDFAYTLPAGWDYEIYAVALTLKVASGKAEAEPSLLLKSGSGAIRGVGVCNLKTKESVTAKYLFQRQSPSTGIAAGGYNTGWLPRVVIDGGGEILSSTTGLEAGDTITNIELFVERFTTDQGHDWADLKAMAERIAHLEKEVADHANHP